MAKQRFKGFQCGMSFRRLKKVLKQQEREAKDFEDKVKCVSGCYVKIKFSKEIAYWDEKAYYENPKFDGWWSKFSAKVAKDHDRYGYLYVAYSSKKMLREEENGDGFWTGIVRWLIMGEKAIVISPQMSFFYIVPPSEFLDCMCEIYMRTILGYCKAEHLDPLETLTLFHMKCEEISLKGHEEAKRELEMKKLS